MAKPHDTIKIPKHPFCELVRTLEKSGLRSIPRPIDVYSKPPSAQPDNPSETRKQSLISINTHKAYCAPSARTVLKITPKQVRMLEDGRLGITHNEALDLARRYYLIPDKFDKELLAEHQKLIDQGRPEAISLTHFMALADDYIEKFKIAIAPPPRTQKSDSASDASSAESHQTTSPPDTAPIARTKNTGRLQDNWEAVRDKENPISVALYKSLEYHKLNVTDVSKVGGINYKNQFSASIAIKGNLDFIRSDITDRYHSLAYNISRVPFSPVEMRFLRRAMKASCEWLEAKKKGEIPESVRKENERITELANSMEEWCPPLIETTNMVGAILVGCRDINKSTRMRQDKRSPVRKTIPLSLTNDAADSEDDVHFRGQYAKNPRSQMAVHLESILACVDDSDQLNLTNDEKTRLQKIIAGDWSEYDAAINNAKSGIRRFSDPDFVQLESQYSALIKKVGQAIDNVERHDNSRALSYLNSEIRKISSKLSDGIDEDTKIDLTANLDELEAKRDFITSPKSTSTLLGLFKLIGEDSKNSSRRPTKTKEVSG